MIPVFGMNRVRSPHRLVISTLLLFVFVSLNVRASYFPEVFSQTQQTDSTSVEKVLTDFNVALAQGNSLKLRDLTGENFRLLDEGKVFDYDSTIASIQATLQTGSMTRVPDNFHTVVRQDVAWSHYRVSGNFQSQSGQIQLDLLEMAVLERVNSKWKIVLVSTMPRSK